MKWCLMILVLALSIISSPAIAAEQYAAERQLKERPINIEEIKKEKLSISSYDEYSWIKQGTKRGHWNFLTTQVSYLFKEFILPYFRVDLWDRLRDHDETYNAGAYLLFEDKSYLRGEIGWGANIDYVYRFQSTLEYEHRLVGNLFWNAGARYLNYSDNDVVIGSPGLRYYFGDHYVSAFYNISSTFGRGIAQWGTVRGDFKLNEKLNCYLGTAVGERLYDIFPLDASKQFGYIIFAGIDYNIYKNLNVRLGYSYSKEKPSFVKQSVDFGASVKF